MLSVIPIIASESGTCMLLIVRAGSATLTRMWEIPWTRSRSRIPCFRAANPIPMMRKRKRIAVKTGKKSMAASDLQTGFQDFRWADRHAGIEGSAFTHHDVRSRLQKPGFIPSLPGISIRRQISPALNSEPAGGKA